MGKTADLTVVQKTIIDTLHKEGKPQTFITKEAVHRVLYPSMLTESWVEGKRCSTNRENRSLMRIVKQNRFKNLGELHKEWTEAGVKASRAPHTDVSRNLATVVIRGVLPGLRRRRTGLLPSGPKSSFQMRASFVFHLETKVLESGGRVEKLIAQVAWSPALRLNRISLSYPFPFPFVLPLALVPRNQVVSARGENIPLWNETPLGYCYVIIHRR